MQDTCRKSKCLPSSHVEGHVNYVRQHLGKSVTATAFDGVWRLLEASAEYKYSTIFDIRYLGAGSHKLRMTGLVAFCPQGKRCRVFWIEGGIASNIIYLNILSTSTLTEMSLCM